MAKKKLTDKEWDSISKPRFCKFCGREIKRGKYNDIGHKKDCPISPIGKVRWFPKSYIPESIKRLIKK